MCSIIAHNNNKVTYADDESSGGGRPIPKNATTEELEALGATLKCIDFWLKLFYQNY